MAEVEPIRYQQFGQLQRASVSVAGVQVHDECAAVVVIVREFLLYALCDLDDRVITVDTSVAHLAGAMGKPVWILLPYNPDCRWLLERSDSPWYPSATLYRQNRGEDWGAVIARVRADLSRIA